MFEVPRTKQIIYNQQNPDRENGSVPAVAPKIAHADFNKYEDPSGEFSSSEFKHGLWYIKHKLLLYKILIGFLIAWIVVFGGYAIITLADYLIFGIVGDLNLQKQLTAFPNYTNIQPKYAPAPLQVQNVTSLPGGSTSFDLTAQVSNPNKNFVVYFDYYFNVGQDKTPVQHGFLLAGEAKPIVYFGLKGGYPGDVNLVLENVAWKRLRAQVIKDPAVYQAERLNFVVSNFSFTSQAASEGLGANVVKFDLKNDSAYGYRDANFVVALTNGGGGVSAVMPLMLKDFKAGETRNIDLRNFVLNLPVSDVQLFPLIDTYNKDVYLAPAE
ncbi:MAG: hypothetical protein NT034_04395 [Candidatus Magasanikbacteria bacterium]|nr:hypothetical protein [Candidatus Magasanikbacteria bacterium]